MKVFSQALSAYKNAFFKNGKDVNICEYSDDYKTDETIQDFEKEALQIAYLLGQSRSREAFHIVEEQLLSVKHSKLSPDLASEFVLKSIEQIDKNYQTILSVDNLKEFSNIWGFNSADEYLEQLFEWFDSFSGKLSKEFEDFQNKQKIRNAVIYIQENYKKPLNMAMVSNEVSMNYSLFSYLFKQYVGSNFVSYLQELRINEAKKLLIQTDMRVNEIGKRVGFTDEKNFLKVFKTVAGLSPTEFRKIEQANM